MKRIYYVFLSFSPLLNCFNPYLSMRFTYIYPGKLIKKFAFKLIILSHRSFVLFFRSAGRPVIHVFVRSIDSVINSAEFLSFLSNPFILCSIVTLQLFLYFSNLWIYERYFRFEPVLCLSFLQSSSPCLSHTEEQSTGGPWCSAGYARKDHYFSWNPVLPFRTKGAQEFTNKRIPGKAWLDTQVRCLLLTCLRRCEHTYCNGRTGELRDNVGREPTNSALVRGIDNRSQWAPLRHCCRCFCCCFFVLLLVFFYRKKKIEI